jgi:hypothetical protein
MGPDEKEKFGSDPSLGINDEPVDSKHKLMHSAAAFDCLSKADKWLERYAPTELATVIHEDGPAAKRLIKTIVRTMRSEDSIAELDVETKKQFNLPLRRIIDTVHFAEKQDARPLQLADLCAFALARILNGKFVPPYVQYVLSQRMAWLNTGQPSQSESGA